MHETPIVEVIRTPGERRPEQLDWHHAHLATDVLNSLNDRNSLGPTMVDGVIKVCVIKTGANRSIAAGTSPSWQDGRSQSRPRRVTGNANRFSRGSLGSFGAHRRSVNKSLATTAAWISRHATPIEPTRISPL